MEKLFLLVLNMSIAGTWLIFAVLFLRFLFKKNLKWLVACVWLLVAIKLIIPFSFESSLSVIPSSNIIDSNIIYSETPSINSGIDIVDGTVNPIIQNNFSPSQENSVNPLQVWILIFSYIWSAGVIMMILYLVISYIVLCKRVRSCINIKDNIYISDYIETPFILGFIRPKIFLPSGLNKITQKNVIAHESSHLKRLDNIWRPLGFLILAVHWFNPFCWISYILFVKDIEFACDEKVVKNMDKEDRISYSESLFELSSPKRFFMVHPLAFGETGVKERIKSTLTYKKPSFWLLFIAIILTIILAICFMANPEGQNSNSNNLTEMYKEKYGVNLDEAITKVIMEDYLKTKESELFLVEDHIILKIEPLHKEKKDVEDSISVYMMVLFEGFDINGKDFLMSSIGYHSCMALSFDISDEGEFYLTEKWIPSDGNKYADSIKEKFPNEIVDDAINTQKFIDIQNQRVYYKFIELNNIDVDKGIEEFMGTILKKLAESSGNSYSSFEFSKNYAEDFTKVEPYSYIKLTQLGKYTLRYSYDKVYKGNPSKSETRLMMALCRDIMKLWGEDFESNKNDISADEWFEEFKIHSEKLRKENSEEEMEKYFPAEFILLNSLKK